MTTALRSGRGKLEQEYIEIADPPVRVRVRRTRAARRISLTVSSIDGRAQLTMPHRCARRAAEAFVQENRAWLKRMVDRVPPADPIAPNARLPFRGRMLLVRGETGRRTARIDLEREEVLASADPALARAQIEAALREAARARLLNRARRRAEELGVAFSRISIRDTRSRWGSCSSGGALSFSWRLVMAPDDVLDYVAAHEVAHLVEMNHSARFWALVTRLRPDWRVQRDWLREHGPDLHRIPLTRAAA